MDARPLPLLLLVTLLSAACCLAMPALSDELQVFAVRDQVDQSGQAADNNGARDDVVVNPGRDVVDIKDSDGQQDSGVDRQGRSWNKIWRGAVKWGSIILG